MDDEISDEVKKEWSKWIAGAERFNVFEVPRCYHEKIKGDVEVTLIGFSDASKKGYAAVLYLRVYDVASGVATSNLVASKTRVAPLEEQTIPRLELLAALILARLLARVRQILHGSVQIEREYCFSDAAVALSCVS